MILKNTRLPFLRTDENKNGERNVYNPNLNRQKIVSGYDKFIRHFIQINTKSE